MIGLAIDGILCLLLVTTALAAVTGRDILAGIVFFVAFGILLAVAWVRLGAVDLAIAEGAIGTGLTGVLLISAWARLRRLGAADEQDRPGPAAGVMALAAGGLALTLVQALAALDPDGAGLQAAARSGLPATGIGNPVTAVLLDYRAFDTLLETIVLVAALVSVWAVTDERHWGGLPGRRHRVSRGGVLATYSRVLPQAGLVVGLYLVWVGGDAPGGAFQGGTVLAAVWLLVVLAGQVEAPRVSSPLARLLAVAGPAGFLAAGLAGAFFGTFLALPPVHAKVVVLAIETGLAASIAAILTLIIIGPPERAAP
jgi:multisubunit Na+/H+ antiporter MnhB subunit